MSRRTVRSPSAVEEKYGNVYTLRSGKIHLSVSSKKEYGFVYTLRIAAIPSGVEWAREGHWRGTGPYFWWAFGGHWWGIGGALAGHWRLLLVGIGWALVGIGGHWWALAHTSAHTYGAARVCGMHTKTPIFICKNALWDPPCLPSGATGSACKKVRNSRGLKPLYY